MTRDGWANVPAASVLAGFFEGAKPEIDARALRRAVFARAAEGGDKERILAEEGEKLGIPRPGDQLFADLAGERALALRHPLPDAHGLLEATNLALARAVLMRSVRVTMSLEGQVRPVVRLAHLQRLLYVARPRATGIELELSGPYALFAHTTRYGRALASLVGPLVGVERWSLLAEVRVRGPACGHRSWSVNRSRGGTSVVTRGMGPSEGCAPRVLPPLLAQGSPRD